ncbi:membrane protein [Dictyobacter formicarum]|uniref:Membrane protein n=2 Tax=Dictyobacter formicarum TaxID=2778368 RepID=A0ABQ3VCI8_9CHLR|nr:membrane protein [Dictyobacter formicarum]
MMGGRRGLPLSVPLPFLLTGVSAAAFFGLLLPAMIPEAMLAPNFPHVLAEVHLATLGWLTMIVMGASLQLTPVMIVAPLCATRFIRWQYPVYMSGVTLLLSGFWWMRPWLMAVGGSLVVLAVIHYTVILGTSLARAATRPLTVRFLVASLVTLCIVVSLGLTMALNMQFSFLGATLEWVLLVHLLLGVVGWLSNTLVGVSYTLVRMFAMAHGHTDRLGCFVFVLLNTGIVILASGFMAAWLPLIAIGGGALVVAVWLFAYDFQRMFRLRRRKVLDAAQYHSIAAVVYLSLVIPAGIAVVLAGWQQSTMLVALGLAALVGWLGQSTIGYLYKIVPFLIWQSRYGPLVGRQKVPLMRELVPERWTWISWWLINGGLLCTLFAVLCVWTLLAQLASGLLGAGLVLAAATVFSALRHLPLRKSKYNGSTF